VEAVGGASVLASRLVRSLDPPSSVATIARLKLET